MSNYGHAEITAVHAPGTELARYTGGQLEEYRARIVMTPEDAKALDDQLRACTRAVLREGTDYGVIPGTNGDQVLLKPGAEKLLQWFGFAYTMHCLDVERDDDGRKQGVTYRCTVVKRLGDVIAEVATCEGYAGYDEGKFYKTAEQAQHEAEAKERYWAERDRRVANPNKWKHLTGYRAPWNTVIKMAQKRAIVGATIDATAAAGLFGQDEDDTPVPEDGGPAWYEQALAEAATFTTEAAGGKLYVEAGRAARDGLCTPKQANHVQNRVQVRIRLLKTATPADAEDLARTARAAAPPPGEDDDETPAAPDAEPASGPAAAAGPEQDAAPAGEYGSERHRKLVGAVRAHFKRLGYTDDDDTQRYEHTARLAGRSELGSTSDLDEDELKAVADTLARCRNVEALKALLEAAEKATDGDYYDYGRQLRQEEDR